ncbi:hypothetical protein LAG90_19370 [Marinilongibacter aquaticus]|uniref:hypothetical protein n=1 Tax=Marinilongibacter aquaticus TaxID=2975157 RepID=UPI0021BDB5CC|nr:hypothetical protein [Marinilongibacter aquaticus]UBM58962.1 hypothetical protein LAG90_19370 [Marinilongibacter aquaticus]
MKNKIWQIAVALVFVIFILVFFVLFPEGKVDPYFSQMPYVLWMGILTTALLVILTFWASQNFPFKDDDRS